MYIFPSKIIQSIAKKWVSSYYKPNIHLISGEPPPEHIFQDTIVEDFSKTFGLLANIDSLPVEIKGIYKY